jgi:hypothetical protein
VPLRDDGRDDYACPEGAFTPVTLRSAFETVQSRAACGERRFRPRGRAPKNRPQNWSLKTGSLFTEEMALHAVLGEAHTGGFSLPQPPRGTFVPTPERSTGILRLLCLGVFWKKEAWR